MPKVTRPLFSGDAWGKFADSIIFRRGGIVTRYYRPRDPKTAAQLAARQAFREMAMAGLTQEQADLLYSAITHLHAGIYSPVAHAHDHGDLAGLGDDDHTQYLTQGRGDARYPLIAHTHSERAFFPFAQYTNLSPISASTYMLMGTVPGLFTLLSLAVSCWVSTPHNSTNYWRLDLEAHAVNGTPTTCGSVSTYNGTYSGNAWFWGTLASFSPSEINPATYPAMAIKAVRVGSPGQAWTVGASLWGEW